MKIFKSINDPISQFHSPSFDTRWRGPDKGLITSWEKGRLLTQEDPDLADRAKKDELPVLGWAGGVEKKIKVEKKGTFYYLAQWQGLRGEDLNIDTTSEVRLICSRTKVKVTYSENPFKED